MAFLAKLQVKKRNLRLNASLEKKNLLGGKIKPQMNRKWLLQNDKSAFTTFCISMTICKLLPTVTCKMIVSKFYLTIRSNISHSTKKQKQQQQQQQQQQKNLQEDQQQF